MSGYTGQSFGALGTLIYFGTIYCLHNLLWGIRVLLLVFSSADCIWKALIWGLKYMGDIFNKHKGFLDYLTKQNKTKKLFYNTEVYFASKIMDSPYWLVPLM